MKNREIYNQVKIFTEDKISAINAKYEAQKIAFGPFSFQAARCLRDFGILKELDESGENGISRECLAEKITFSDYSLGVLLEMGLSMDVVKYTANSKNTKYELGKVGYFLLHDEMTNVNMDFVHDVCYMGNFDLDKSLINGKPEGLKHFGSWDTIYEGLSSLSDKVRKSWFSFDHFYSDAAFPDALKYVFNKPRKKLLDIGGNTAKWAVACINHDSDVAVTIVDLPGQANVARKKIEEMGFSNRISIYEANVLKLKSSFPKGCDAVWMSQFLDCFSLKEITDILSKVYNAIDTDCEIFVMEPLWDKQKYQAAAYSLHATSLYFTSMANGNSKMYKSTEIKDAIERAGFIMVDQIHELGPNDYSILKFKKLER